MSSDGLKELKIVHGSTAKIVEDNGYKDFWPGGLAHSLGLDVHDGMPQGFGGPDAEKTLVPGMVITIEPGFYSQDFNYQIPETYKHIGIRIEDDVFTVHALSDKVASDLPGEMEERIARIFSGERG